MGATILITREERSGERELGKELGVELVFVALTKIVNPPPAPPSDPSFHSGSQGGVCHPERSEGPTPAPYTTFCDNAELRTNPPPAPPSDPSFHSGSQGGVCHPERSEGPTFHSESQVGGHIAHRASHIALTSRNAVEALRSANLLNELRGKEIWCVGPATASALGDIPHHISPGTTGEDLANFMLASGVTGDVLHICGEPHRPELRSRMLEAGCRMKEWIVYETVPLEAELPKETIDAVAFFSPAAVKQFKALGWTESLPVPYIAIGPTTASELSPCTCSVSSEASFRGVLEESRRILNVQL